MAPLLLRPYSLTYLAMTALYGFEIDALSDELLIDLLAAFATARCWDELIDYQVIAAAVIDRQLTVQFHTFIKAQIGL